MNVEPQRTIPETDLQSEILNAVTISVDGESAKIRMQEAIAQLAFTKNTSFNHSF